MTNSATEIKEFILPKEGFVRIEIAMAIFGCKKTKFQKGIKEGVIPKPHKWGRTSLWDVGEIREAIGKLKSQ